MITKFVRVSSTTRLFADDCLMYRTVSSEEDAMALQEDRPTTEVGSRLGDEIHPGQMRSYPHHQHAQIYRQRLQIPAPQHTFRAHKLI